jgi:hypothetical protein
MTVYYDPRLDWAIDDAEAARPALETLVGIIHGDHYHHSMTELDVCEDDAARLRSCERGHRPVESLELCVLICEVCGSAEPV